MTLRAVLSVLATTLVFLAPARTCRGDDIPTPEKAGTLFAGGDWAAAARAYELLSREHPEVPAYWYRLATSRVSLGEFKAALPAFEEAMKRGTPEGPARYGMARAHARLGAREAALECLEKSAAAGFVKADKVLAEADLAPLRDEARFKAVVEKLQNPTRGMKGADALDHWVGEWDVYVQGQKVGQNRIVKALDGFAVEEFWESRNGGRGRSLFVFEAAKGRWKQLWTSDGGWIVEKVGTPVENGIYLEGTGTYADGSVKKSREYLTRNADGSVRQLLEDWNEQAKEWKVTFDGKYVRRTK